MGPVALLTAQTRLWQISSYGWYGPCADPVVFAEAISADVAKIIVYQTGLFGRSATEYMLYEVCDFRNIWYTAA